MRVRNQPEMQILVRWCTRPLQVICLRDGEEGGEGLTVGEGRGYKTINGRKQVTVFLSPTSPENTAATSSLVKNNVIYISETS